MKTTELSRKSPTNKPGKKTVVIKTGLPKDRLKGYRDDRTMFTGADAQAALVGQYSKKNKKGFKAGKGSSRSSGGY